LVLDLIARGESPSVEIDDPVAAIKLIARDPELKQVVRRTSGGSVSALDLQAEYYGAAKKVLAGQDEESDWILREWGETLALLAADRAQLVGRLDWVTKLWLLDTFVREERIGWNDPWLASLDLEYHNVDPERGLFLGLEAEGRTVRLTQHDAVNAAMSAGPSDTRGGIRGQCIRRFPDQIKSIQWERVQFRGGLMPNTLDLSDLFEPDAVRALSSILEAAESPTEVITMWNQGKVQR
jgi:Pup amidohydrolase